MTTHKKYIKELKPVTFITFDNDTLWDKNSRYLIYENEIPDESDNGEPVPAILHYDKDDGLNVMRPSYYMGQQSLIANQRINSYGLVIAPHGFDTMNKFKFVKSYIEIPYTDALRLQQAFTYSFMINIPRSPSDMRSWIWNNDRQTYVQTNSTNGYNYSNLRRTIVKKGDKFSITYCSPYSSYEYLDIKFPNNSGTVPISNIEGGIITKPLNIVATHDYITMDDGRYYTKSSVYINMRLIYSRESSPVYGNYDGGNTAPVLFCGNQDGIVYNTLDDRWTSPIYLDQIAIFDYALNEYQVCMMYKKIESYEDMILYGYPSRYYKFDEDEKSLYFEDLVTKHPNYRLYPPSQAHQIRYSLSGVHGIYGDTCVGVQSGGMIYCDVSNDAFFNTSGDFTIEFFASFGNSSRGVLLSIQDTVQPFRGVCLYVNSKNNEEYSGMLQLSVTDDYYCHTDEFNVRGERIMYNDGKVRHYAIRRSGNFVELWIDGSYINKVFLSAGSLTARSYNSLYIFNMSPSVMRVDGTIQHLACYTRALSAIELYAHATYLVRYKMSGRITVNGIGEEVMIRIYSFLDGDLLIEENTLGDGVYNIDVYYADYINFIAQIRKDTTVRPRIIGPILADEYEDVPWE